jgi:hypothetical protein
VFIEPARSSRGSSAAGHTPDDQQLGCHDMLLAQQKTAKIPSTVQASESRNRAGGS